MLAIYLEVASLHYFPRFADTFDNVRMQDF